MFIKIFLNNCRKNHAIEKFIELERYVGIVPNVIFDDASTIRRSLLAIIVLNKQIYSIFVDSLRKLDENKRNILLLKFKREIESLFENVYHIPDTLKKWEIMQYENNSKIDVITTIGNCSNCGNIAFNVNIFNFFELFWFFGEYIFNFRNNLNLRFLNQEILNIIINANKEKTKTNIQKIPYTLCKNKELKIFFGIVKDVNDGEIYIHIDKNMKSWKDLAIEAKNI